MKNSSRIEVRPDEENILRGLYARWLYALSDEDFIPDEDYFRLLAYVLNDRDCKKYVASLARAVESRLGRARAEEVLKDGEDGRFVHANLERDAREDETLLALTLEFNRRLARETADRADKRAEKKFFRPLTDLFALDATSRKICEFAFAANACAMAQNFFFENLRVCEHGGRPLLARMLGVAANRLNAATNNLIESGVLVDRGDRRALEPRLEAALKFDRERLRSRFCAPLPKTTLGLERFRLSEEVKEHALKLLSQKDGEATHILLYGAPGTGKTSFAACLAKTLKLRGWAVAATGREQDGDRRVALAACARMVARKPGALMLVDEADKLLDTNWFSGSVSKAWLTSLLEWKGVKAVWICNDIDNLEPAIRRRFCFGVFFPELGEREREEIWGELAKSAGLSQRLGVGALSRFARLYNLPPASMETALRQAKKMEKGDGLARRVEIILQSQREMRLGGKKAGAREEIVDFDPDLVTMSQSPKVVLKRLRRLLNVRDRDCAGSGNLLLYGPPGTGKTVFARWLARELGMELILKRPSDLLGGLVGETEKNVAAAFEEAGTGNAFLLIDEADCFLPDRASARHSWERSMVNEFLTWLENFTGICAFATNARELTDAAASRRFSFKIGFDYARPELLPKIYAKILAPLADGAPPPALMEKLRSLDCLAPGDFKTVKRRFFLEDAPSHADIVEALLEERRLKLDGETQRIGFKRL